MEGSGRGGGQAEMCFVIKHTETLEMPLFITVRGLCSSKDPVNCVGPYGQQGSLGWLVV